MIPLRDANPTHRIPFITIGLIVLNALFFLVELNLESTGQLSGFIQRWAVIPAELRQMPWQEAPTLLTAMFLHGGWSHLLGNMLYLWIFGDNIEDRMGHGRFLIFYLLCGVLASLAQTIAGPNVTVPNLGASGAIAGVLGAYLLEFPRARITTLVFYFFVQVPALIVLGFWFVIQFFQGFASLGTIDMQAGGVAFFAHVGGFIAGFVLVRPFLVGRRPARGDGPHFPDEPRSFR